MNGKWEHLQIVWSRKLLWYKNMLSWIVHRSKLNVNCRNDYTITNQHEMVFFNAAEYTGRMIWKGTSVFRLEANTMFTYSTIVRMEKPEGDNDRTNLLTYWMWRLTWHAVDGNSCNWKTRHYILHVNAPDKCPSNVLCRYNVQFWFPTWQCLSRSPKLPLMLHLLSHFTESD